MTMNGNNKLPRIICVGSNIESQIALTALINARVNVVAIITRPPNNAGNVCDYVDLHQYCEENNIKTIDTININSEKTLIEIKNEKPDYIFTLGWNQLFKETLLSIPSKFIIGSHPSILPSGRGRAPVPWTILENLKESAVSFFKMDFGADSGDLLHQEYFKISNGSYAFDVYKLIATSLSKGFIYLYNKILKENISTIQLPNVFVSYRAKRSYEDGLINFNNEAEDIDRLIRAVSFPYPGSHTYYDEKMIKIWKCSLINITKYSAIPGQILEKTKDSLLVFAKQSAIWLMDITDPLGNPIDLNIFKIGSKLGYQYDDEIFRIKKELEKIKTHLNNE